MSVRILIGDCRERLRELPDNSVDSVVCDPPYHLVSQDKRDHRRASPSEKQRQKVKASTGFMGQAWDGGDVAFQPETWAEVMRVLKPGGHLVAFSGTRTYHRMAVAIEDAGFEVRDMLSWLYGSGFPKSRDIGKDMDRLAGEVREVVGTRKAPGMAKSNVEHGAQTRSKYEFTELSKEPISAAAREWQGYGTALKPAHEPICLARKPLSEKSVAANVLRWGTGAINVDACRIEGGERPLLDATAKVNESDWGTYQGSKAVGTTTQGRWPANVCHDGSDEVVAGFPESDGAAAAVGPQYGRKSSKNAYGDWGPRQEMQPRGDSGSAARFFYCAKATTEERGEGNNHPTVKPIALMEWLVKLVTPKGGTVLDPFMGSGSTALACDRLQFAFIGCELSSDYAEIAASRLRAQAGMFANISLEMCGPETRAA